MGQSKKNNIKSIEKEADNFYKKYDIQSSNVPKNDALKSNGNFKFVWDIKINLNVVIKQNLIIEWFIKL